MNIDKISDFKSSILDEVYRHQGFITAISNTLESYDEEKRQQLSQLVSEQQRKINKSLGLIYSFFRTVNSFDELENKIKEIVGDDLDNAFAFEGSEEFSKDDASVVSSGDLGLANDAQSDSVSVNEVSSDDNVVAVVENENNISTPQSEEVSVQSDVSLPENTENVVVSDNTGVVPQTEASTSDFVLSPIEEGVVAAPASVDVSNIENEVVTPIAEVGEQQPTVSADAMSVVEQSVVDNQVSEVPARFIRISQQPGRAILVTTSQFTKLSDSKEAQKALLANSTPQSLEVIPVENSVQSVNLSADSQEVGSVENGTQPVNLDVQQQVQMLMNQASQAYAAGDAEKAQLFMNQASELNKQIQGNNNAQISEGNAFVKKGNL